MCCLDSIVACSCVVYESQGRSNGVFMTPNFPEAIPNKIDCLLFNFIGKPDELVELTFLDFDIHATANNRYETASRHTVYMLVQHWKYVEYLLQVLADTITVLLLLLQATMVYTISQAIAIEAPVATSVNCNSTCD